MGQTLRPGERAAARRAEFPEGALGRAPNGNGHIDRRENKWRDMIRMHGHYHGLAEPLRKCERRLAPCARQHVMSLVEHEPMRPAGARTHGLKIRHELGEEIRPIHQGYAQEVDAEINPWILQER
jgi:hypothetical protein